MLTLLKNGLKPFGRQLITHCSLSTSAIVGQQGSKNVAMVLSGCGVYDGTEIIEACSAIIHLSKHKSNISFFAPNIEQLHVINHSNGEIMPELRNVLVESARITRGNINSLSNLKAANFDALFIPGGFGAAKNLSDFAVNGTKMSVNKEVERVLLDFIQANKPIGMCCIAPVIAAKVLPQCELTVGKSVKSKEWPYSYAADEIQTMGAVVVERDVNETHTDPKYKIVTTPAFMKTASFYEIFDGIGKMVEKVLQLA